MIVWDMAEWELPLTLVITSEVKDHRNDPAAEPRPFPSYCAKGYLYTNMNVSCNNEANSINSS